MHIHITYHLSTCVTRFVCKFYKLEYDSWINNNNVINLKCYMIIPLPIVNMGVWHEWYKCKRFCDGAKIGLKSPLLHLKHLYTSMF